MKRSITIMLALLLLLCLAACGEKPESNPAPTPTEAPAAPAETTPPPAPTEEPVKFDLDAYKADVSGFRAKVMDNSLYLYNVAKYLNNYLETRTKLGGTVKLDEDNIASGYEWLLEKANVTKDDIDTANDDIRTIYKAIILAEIDGKEAEEIDAQVRDMFDAYSGLYDLVNTPTDAVTTFASKCNEYTGAINGADEKLGLFLD